MKKLFPILLILALLAGCGGGKYSSGVHHAEIAVEGYGVITLELDADTAPVTVENFCSLAESGFYDGLTFHRIISGVMAQGGCPLGNGTGGSGENIQGEFSGNGIENPLKHERGVLSMARSSDPNSASSQFFIMHADATHLDGNYAAFGRVIAGMDTVDALCLNAHVTDSNGTVPKEDQPVMKEVRRVDRAEAEAAAEKESENGAEGFSFDDPATGVRFPMPEGWRLQEKGNGNYLFTDGTATLTLSTVDVWRRMGKSTQAQYMDAGYARETLNTDAFERSAFASAIGVAEEDMTEENINGALWLAAAEERNGETVQYRVGAVKGTVIIFAGAEGAAAETVKIMIETLTVD